MKRPKGFFFYVCAISRPQDERKHERRTSTHERANTRQNERKRATERRQKGKGRRRNASAVRIRTKDGREARASAHIGERTQRPKIRPQRDESKQTNRNTDRDIPKRSAFCFGSHVVLWFRLGFLLVLGGVFCFCSRSCWLVSVGLSQMVRNRTNERRKAWRFFVHTN